MSKSPRTSWLRQRRVRRIPFRRLSSRRSISSAAIEEMIKRFDIPANAAKNVEITAYLLVASTQSETDSIPAVIKPAFDQLRGDRRNDQAFRYPGKRREKCRNHRVPPGCV